MIKLMSVDKSLRIALLISALFHTIIFFPWFHFRRVSTKKNSSLEITYLVLKKLSSKKIPKTERPVTAVKHEPEKKDLPPEPKKDGKTGPERKIAEKEFSPSKTFAEDTEIEIPPELPKEKEGIYLDYYQSIREKIRRYVEENYSYYIDCGEVCLYFILVSEGKLKELRIVEERSTQNQFLKEIAKKSIRQASPFLPFPEDLNQSQLSFNVIISFELEN